MQRKIQVDPLERIAHYTPVQKVGALAERPSARLPNCETNFKGTLRLGTGWDQITTTITGDVEEVFIVTLMLVLSRAEKLPIDVCPEDKKLFYRVRRQRFCSRRCTQTAAKRAWRRGDTGPQRAAEAARAKAARKK